MGSDKKEAEPLREGRTMRKQSIVLVNNYHWDSMKRTRTTMADFLKNYHWDSTKRTKTTMADWSKLPDDVLSLICKQLTVVIDYLHFRGVCKSWRDVALSDGNILIPPPPWLMLGEPNHIKDNVGDNADIIPWRGFIGFSELNKIYQLELPEAHQRKPIGSTGSWVIIEEETEQTEQILQLFNPFCRALIDLPPFKQSVYPEYGYVDGHDDEFVIFMKVVLSSSSFRQNPRDCIAMGINTCMSMSCGLCFARPGDESWTAVSLSPYDREIILDVIFFMGQFYAISYGCSGSLLACDIDSNPPKAKPIMFFSERYYSDDLQCYLVELLGELLLVVYYEDDMDDCSDEMEDCVEDETQSHISASVEVYKLDLVTKQKEEVKSLGDYCLLLGGNTSVAVLASDSSPWRRNCIYFADENHSCGKNRTDVCFHVYDMDESSLEPHHFKCYTHNDPPIWIIPKSVTDMIEDYIL